MSFFSRPHEFSFKDLLAIVFSGSFLYFCLKATGSKEALAVVQSLVPLVGIILGGYFVQESAAMWMQRSQGPQTNSSYYNQSVPIGGDSVGTSDRGEI
ncbi:MAG: hypothetical protein ACOY9Y_06685 [Bacillota bacterium]